MFEKKDESAKKFVKKKNKHAAIKFDDFLDIQNKVNEFIPNINSLSPSEKAIWGLMQHVIEKSNEIISCDLPTDDEQNDALVHMIHHKADWILGKSDESKYQVPDFDRNNASMITKVTKIGQISKNIGAGNCQEKAYYAFIKLLQELIRNNLTTAQHAISLELAYFRNHFILIVNRQFILDPWLSISFIATEKAIKTLFKDFGGLTRSLVLMPDWQCYVEPADQSLGEPLVLDTDSSNDIYNFYQTLRKKFDAEAKELSIPQKMDTKSDGNKASSQVTQQVNFQAPKVEEKNLENKETSNTSTIGTQGRQNQPATQANKKPPFFENREPNPDADEPEPTRHRPIHPGRRYGPYK